MRPAAVLAIVALLAACSGAGPPPPATEQTSASFIAGGVANVISVDATDRLALRQAELIAPDGHATAASSVTASPAPTQNFSGQFPASPYAGAQFGVSSIGSNALSPGYVGMAAPQSQTRLLAIVSTASIPVPDPVAYRRDWQKFRIRLRFGTPPQLETREITAPAPPG